MYVFRDTPTTWAPRWMASNYGSSTANKIYYLGVIYYRLLMQKHLDNTTIPHFYSELKEPRSLYSVTYDKKGLCYSVRAGSSFAITKKDTKGSLLYEHVDPVYFLDGSKYYFKNIDIASTAVTALSGFIPVSGILSDLDPDSPFILKDSNNDIFVIDQHSDEYLPASGLLRVVANDEYTLYYSSLDRISKFKSGEYYVTIDSQPLVVTLEPLHNSLDEWSLIHGFERKPFETNASLKQKNQHLAIAKSTSERISVMLKASSGFWWGTASALSIGTNEARCLDFPYYQYIEEQPVKYSASTFILAAEPTVDIQVLVDGKTNTEYSVSGSVLTFTSRDPQPEAVKIKYKHTRVEETTSLTVVDDTNLPVIGILCNRVIVSQNSKAIKDMEWKWNKEMGVLTGNAEFDF